jgi:trans-aconitate methyltransferase
MPDFDAKYREDTDPWDVAASWYEQRKLSVLLAALPSSRYRTAWEPGCGPGITTAALAARCDHLTATDSSQVAVDLAQKRCPGSAHVEILQSALPAVPVMAPVELVVAAEFLYYVRDLGGALDALWSVCAPGSHVAFLHWAFRPDDAYRSGPDMHAQIAIDAVDRNAMRVVSHLDVGFMLDIYQAMS